MIVDIHTHILPGVDDGAADYSEALEMARMAVADGTTHLFATPHHRDCTPLTRTEVADRVAKLQDKLDKANIPLTVIPGHEVRLYNDMLDDWAKELAGPLGNSRYVLAEPLFHHYDKHTNAMLFELFDRGYIPIMAHPERILPIQKDLSLIEPFLERGGLTQITSGSIFSSKDRLAHQTAQTMLRNGMAHIIASDAHKPYRRRPILTKAGQAAARIVGSMQAEAMISTNPAAIVQNKLISTPKIAV
ncbi:MAG: capsular biosynthesis protein [Anaerolineae bacterium]|nr:capsular biosynthesis protein [Anaerolineae bacterium]